MEPIPLDCLIKKVFRGQIQLSELRGKFRFQLFWTGIDKYYNQNELGFFNLKNAQSFRSLIRYRIRKKNKILRSYSNYLSISQRHDLIAFYELVVDGGLEMILSFKISRLFEIDFDYTGSNRDFYEPRTEDRYLIEPANYGVKAGFQTNNNNTFSYGIEYEISKYKNKQFDENKSDKRFQVDTKYRLSNKVTISASSQSENTVDDVGYLQRKNGEIHFGIRDVKSFENTIDLNL